MGLLDNKLDILIYILILECVLTFPYIISSFFVAETANVGFNSVFSGFLNVGFLIGAFYVLKQNVAPIAYGFLIGSSSMVNVLNFLTCTYWVQLSHCEHYHAIIPQYSCGQKSAYIALMIFSSLLLISGLAFTVGLLVWRRELQDKWEIESNNDIGKNPYSEHSFPIYSVSKSVEV